MANDDDKQALQAAAIEEIRADEPYKFHLPIRLLRIEDGYRILDASEKELCFIHGRRGPGATTTFMTMKDAEQVAKAIAKMIRATGFPKY